MRIGVIGTGNIGRVLIERMRSVGHAVTMTNASGAESIRDFAIKTGAPAVAIEEIGLDVDILFLVIPERNIPHLPKAIFQNIKPSTVIVDVGNYYPVRDGQIAEIDKGLTESEWVSKQIGHPVVKAFNSISSASLISAARTAGASDRVALPISGEVKRSKEVVANLIDQLGFDSFDAGSLSESWRQQPGSPVYCTNLALGELRAWLTKVNRKTLPENREKGLQIFSTLPAGFTPHDQVKAYREAFLK